MLIKVRCQITFLMLVNTNWKVLYNQNRAGEGAENLLESEERHGICLGHSRTSNEVLVGTKEGVVRAYSWSRQPEDQRWDARMIEEMRGTPQQPDPRKPGEVIPVHVGFDAPEEGEEEKVKTK